MMLLHVSQVKQLAERENCPLAAVGTVTGDGRVTFTTTCLQCD